MNRRDITLVLVVAVTLFPVRTRADVAAPEVDACALLPAGSPCTEDGRLSGQCVQTGNRPGDYACRVLARNTASPQPAAPAASASVGNPGTAVPGPAKSIPHACSVNATSFAGDTSVSVHGWILLSLGAVLLRRRKG
jgi:hypothetical protein